MSIRISFSDKIVRVAVEIDGKIESAITELPQRQWVGLTQSEYEEAVDGLEDLEDCWMAIEAKLRSKNGY